MARVSTSRVAYKALHKVADRAVDPVADAFLARIRDTLRTADMPRLKQAIAARDLTGAVAALRLDTPRQKAARARYARELRKLFVLAAVTAEKQFPITVNLRFDLTNQEAVTFAAERSAQLVTAVSEATKQNIRAVIARGFSEGNTVDTMAKEIRSLVGLTARQGQAVENARTGLELRLRVARGEALEDVAAEFGIAKERAAALMQRSYDVVGRTTKLDEELITARTEKYAAQQLRYRARMIARSETIRSSTAGAQSLWGTAAAEGYIDPESTRQFWIITEGDERTCIVCLAIPGMNADGVPLGGQFQTPAGPVTAPPEPHPNCRCALSIETNIVDQKETKAA